ncbi:ATP-binding protein [Curtobacterium sp. UCD-KPL2560]|uniref:ATP-binding protein n=1 Tax=Curtobacterium sp. UCD-KPL2560 TaxID=1885315 RepID=UPI000824A086|nr:ATP-binding protein [Curtobacterium sp. UCD-KPL2560]
MSTLFSLGQLRDVVDELRAAPTETEVAEFKEAFANPVKIGEYVSALANSATLVEKDHGFLVWGVNDVDHRVVGTTFDPAMKGKGNEDLEPWLRRLLDPEVFFEFTELEYETERIVVLTVAAASHQPVRFQGEAYVRSRSYVKHLKSLPDHERRLWAAFDRKPFEYAVARERLSDDEVLRLLDYASYFDLMHAPVPDSSAAVLQALLDEKLVLRAPGSGWRITNLGAVLFASRLDLFPTVARKAPRVIVYEGIDKSTPAREQEGLKGYASGFKGLINFLNERTPARESFEGGVRKVVPVLPDKAVRELVANALIHQDFSVRGTGPVVEVYQDRIEVTNPGRPLMDPSRLIDAAPQSRNEALASLMRRMGMCEERGSGWDQIAALVEETDLPAPLIEVDDGFMRVILFTHRSFAELTKDERVRAVYFHACLQYVRRRRMTNASLRQRFRIPETGKANVSRLIKDAIDTGYIAAFDPSVGAKAMSYVPFWARPADSAV